MQLDDELELVLANDAEAIQVYYQQAYYETVFVDDD